MLRACSTYGGEERRGAYRALVGKAEGRNHLEVLGLHGRIILKWIFKKSNGRHWFDLAEDRDRWRAAVNAVMNIRVP